MPLPLIPIIFGGISLITGVIGAAKTVSAAQRISEAKDRYEQRRREYEKKHAEYVSLRGSADRRVTDLGALRLQGMLLLGKVVDVLKKANVKERDLKETLDIPAETLRSWETASVQALEVIGGIANAGMAGAATATAAYGLIGLFGTASTGTAITVLSGAAATNATLAWLGGGAIAVGGGGMALGTFVLGGLIAGPAILVVGFFAQGQAGEIENTVHRNISEMEKTEAGMNKETSLVNIILKRVDEVEMSIKKVSSELEILLTKIFPESPLEEIYLLVKTAKVLGVLLDTPIIDKNGNPIQ